MNAIPIFPGEVGLGFGVVLLTGAAFFIVQSVFNMTSTIQNRYVELLPVTYTSQERAKVISQDTKKDTSAKPILPSDNERTGIEFSYSFYLLINDSTFDGADVLHPVFYKGYPDNAWPLQAPGVYIKGDTNTMRIIMSSFNDAYNHIDVENIPVNKWFHVVLNFQKLALEVHVNGKLAKKLLFNDTLPYFNYESLTIFPNNLAKTINRAAGLPTVAFSTPPNAKISNLFYTRYALSFNEIQQMFSKGPSNMTATPKSVETPPYFADSWWVSQNQ